MAQSTPGSAPPIRRLTAGEWADLSGGLALALQRAGVEPRIEARAHPAARIGALWRGGPPIIAIGRTIWWPGAQADFAGHHTMAVLQHELQHLLDYADGRLTVAGYLLNPRNWRYGYDLSIPWDNLGAEARASLAEDLWRLERRDGPQADSVKALRQAIPWA
jgi:hypothetical protein